MAITINIYYSGKDGNARKYEYFLPLDAPETVLLIDSWEDQHAIDIHHTSPMMEQITRHRNSIMNVCSWMC
jgi:quinol monooxygenase YgiN